MATLRLRRPRRRDNFSPTEPGHPKKRPPQFWEGIERLPLVKNVLREFNERTVQVRADTIRQKRWTPNHLLMTRSERRALLKKFARRGGPDLTDLRCGGERGSPDTIAVEIVRAAGPGWGPIPVENWLAPSAKSTMYDGAFAQHLLEHDIRLPEHKGRGRQEMPANKAEILAELSKSRDSLAHGRIGETQLQRFRNINRVSWSDSRMGEDALPMLDGGYRGMEKAPLRITPLNTLAHLTDGTLPNIEPHRCYGSLPYRLRGQICKALERQIIPTVYEDAIIAPSFFVQARRPECDPEPVEREMGYSLALGARGIHAIRQYGTNGDDAFDGKAYAMGTTLHDGKLRLYAAHPTKGQAGRVGYTVTQLGEWEMDRSIENYRAGAKAHRNARDLADRMRDDIIQAANERVAPGEPVEEPREEAPQQYEESEDELQRDPQQNEPRRADDDDEDGTMFRWGQRRTDA